MNDLKNGDKHLVFFVAPPILPIFHPQWLDVGHYNVNFEESIYTEELVSLFRLSK